MGKGLSVSTGEAQCYECKGSFAMDSMISFQGSRVCAGCKPIFFQRVKEGLDVSTGIQYADIGERFVAKAIDGLVVVSIYFAFALLVVVASAFGWGSEDGASSFYKVFAFSLRIVVAAAYNIYFVGRFGATPGKMALKIKIITQTGENMSYRRATSRYFSEWLSSLTIGLGYLVAFIDEERRTLHDRICDTRVVKA